MATLGNLCTQVGQRVDDEAHRRFTLVELRTWINEGTREVARRSECLFATAAVVVAAADQFVTAPTDTVRLHYVTFTPDSDPGQTYPLDYFDIADMANIWGTWTTTESSYPYAYTTTGFPPTMQITLAPVPTSAGDLAVYYYRFPAALATDGTADGSTVDLPTGWEDLTVDYAVGLCARKDRKLDEYQIAMQVFQDRLKALVDTATRYNDSPGQIMPNIGWGSGAGVGGFGGGYDGGW